MEKKKQKTKSAQRKWMLVFLLINLAVVAYIAVDEYRKEAGSVTFIDIFEVKLGYLFLGVACFCLGAYMLCLSFRKMLRLVTGQDCRRAGYECALLGKYYDNVTPMGAGGQPFQILYLKQSGFSNGASSAVPIMGFLTQQFAFILIAIVVFVANRNVIDAATLVRVQAYVGFLFYAAVPAAVCVFAAFPKAFLSILNAITALLTRLHIVKDRERSKEKITAVMDEYVSSLRIMWRRPGFLLGMLLLCVVYQAAILSIPFFMLRAFGGTGNWWDTFSLVVYIYAAITIIPSPGNSGAAEGYFYAVFSQLQDGFLFWAVIGWRFLVYYMWLIIGLIITARAAVRGTKSGDATDTEEADEA